MIACRVAAHRAQASTVTRISVSLMRKAARQFWRVLRRVKAGAYHAGAWTRRAARAFTSFFAGLDAVALATVVLAAIAYLQWLTLEKTDQTMRLQQRAWIAPGHLVPPQNFVDQKEEDAAIGLTFQNVGKEPAIEMNEQIEVDVVDADKWRDNAFIDAKVREMLGSGCESLRPSPDGRAILPSTPRTDYRDLEADKAIKASKDQTNYFVLAAACFAYRTLDKVHRSEFCGVLAPPNRSNDFKWQTVLCTVHNGAD